MALKQVKNKIVATKKTGQVTKAMEAVSAVKMRKSQERAFTGRPYVRSAVRILARLVSSREVLAHPLIQSREARRRLVILVTSDKGLAGSINSAVLKQMDQLLADGLPSDILAIGRKAVDYANRMGLDIVSEYTNISDGVGIEDVSGMVETVMKKFEDLEYSSVEIVYQNFISTFEQQPTHRRVLPLDPAELQFILSGIKPRSGKWSDEEAISSKVVDHLVEPSSEMVMSSLIPRLVKIIIYHALLESKASEHSARMVAMKNATDKSKELIKSLTIKYNKVRQAKITAEISEITAGAEAIK